MISVIFIGICKEEKRNASVGYIHILQIIKKQRATKELSKYDIKFKQLYRISKELFSDLVKNTYIEDTNFRKRIKMEERLLIILR